jgi:hypothetical protein
MISPVSGSGAPWPTTATRSRCPRAFTFRTTKSNLSLELEVHKTALSLSANQERDGAGTFERDPPAIGRSKIRH